MVDNNWYTLVLRQNEEKQSKAVCGGKKRKMANQEHLNTLLQGLVAWNQWRRSYPELVPDLRSANLANASFSEYILSRSDLADANLTGATISHSNIQVANLSNADLSRAFLPGNDFSRANLSSANFSNSNLFGVNFSGADLSGANLSNSNLAQANFVGANLSNANLTQANLAGASFSNTLLRGANLYKCKLWNTTLAQVDLTHVKSLETIEYRGPSYIDLKSVRLPDNDVRLLFLRGVGCSEAVINSYSSLFTSTEQNVCFMSYSIHDDIFAQRLYSDLQEAGIRCWFTLHDLHTNLPVLRGLDNAIQLQEKVLILLSQNAVKSSWIEREVEMALHQEKLTERNVLFPVYLDDAVFQSQFPWFLRLHQHHVEDFTNWHNETAYAEALAVLIGNLQI